jgi:O-6-methylguanine DNA methyltransferase
MAVRKPLPAPGRRKTASDPGPFAARVLTVVRRIPVGRVATYGDVARLAGRPRAARAVGNIMKGNRRPDVPCHRVIAAGGRIGGYGGNEILKRGLLQAEGITVSGSRIRGFGQVRWPDARPRKPPRPAPRRR